MNQEDLTAALRLFYFVAEEVVGIGIVVAMTIVSLVLGTYMISSFGDHGGYVWLVITYCAYLSYYSIFETIKKRMRHLLV